MPFSQFFIHLRSKEEKSKTSKHRLLQEFHIRPLDSDPFLHQQTHNLCMNQQAKRIGKKNVFIIGPENEAVYIFGAFWLHKIYKGKGYYFRLLLSFVNPIECEKRCCVGYIDEAQGLLYRI